MITDSQEQNLLQYFRKLEKLLNDYDRKQKWIDNDIKNHDYRIKQLENIVETLNGKGFRESDEDKVFGEPEDKINPEENKD